ncbi:MAG: hypothetical protein ACKPKO_04720, partial [Candidatus Fonsibacter sp.]
IKGVVVLTPSNVDQFAIDWKGKQAIARSSYWAVEKCSGENNNATYVLKNVVDGVWLHNHNNIHTIKWGVHKKDLDRPEDQLHKHQIPLMHTWRYHRSPFPNTTGYNDSYPMLELATGFKWNIEFDEHTFQMFLPSWINSNTVLMVN